MRKHIFYFKYCDRQYSLNISNQTVKNEDTGEAIKIENIRDLGLIHATRICFDEALRPLEYGGLFK